LYVNEVSSDPDYIKYASKTDSGLACAWGSSNSVKRRRIVNVRGGLFLDFLNRGPLSFGDDAEQLAVDLDRIGVQSTQLVEHDEQADACRVDGIELACDEKFTGALAAPCCLKLLLGYCERVVWIDDGDVGTGETCNFIELLANVWLESRGRCGLVEYFLTRYFDGSTVLLSKNFSTVESGDSRQGTYLEGAVAKEDGLCGHNCLERAKEREEP
jgi:hypothetical protein